MAKSKKSASTKTTASRSKKATAKSASPKPKSVRGKKTATPAGGKRRTAGSKKKSPVAAEKAKAASSPKPRKKATTATAAKAKAKRGGTSKEVTMDRRGAASDRRDTPDRRKKSVPVAVERRTLQRRAKVTRRRQIDPTTCERDYSGEEIEFMNAMDEYKRTSGRMFPTCSEVLEVLRKLGYGKLPLSEPSPPGEIAPETAIAPACEQVAV